LNSKFYIHPCNQTNLLGLKCNFCEGVGEGWAKCKVFCKYSLKKTERARGIPHFLYEYLVFTIVSEVASLDGHVVGRYPGIFGGDYASLFWDQASLRLLVPSPRTRPLSSKTHPCPS